MIWVKWGSALMFLAVALGAFGSHALKDKLSEYSLDVYKTAVLYHMIHALGLFVVAWLSNTNANPKVEWVGILLIMGIILFSGSLYLLAITGRKWLGAITPLGGLSFWAAWLVLFICATRKTF